MLCRLRPLDYLELMWLEGRDENFSSKGRYISEKQLMHLGAAIVLS